MTIKSWVYRLVEKRFYFLITAKVAAISIMILFVILSNVAISGPVPDTRQMVSDTDEDFPWGIFYPAFIIKKSIKPPLPSAPYNQFNIGDSIGEGEAVDGIIGQAHHDKVWSTGYDVYDIVYSLNERFEDADPEFYNENKNTMDGKYNKAVSGAVMDDFVSQVNNVVAEATTMGGAGIWM